MHFCAATTFQNALLSNIGIATTEPPEMIGESTLRAMPPTWKSGIWLQQMSSVVSWHADAMHTAPESRSSTVCGTTFLFPVDPEVCSTIATSSRCCGRLLSAARCSVFSPAFSPARPSDISKTPQQSGDGTASITTRPSSSATARMPSLSSPRITRIAFALTFFSSPAISCGVFAGLSGAHVQYVSTATNATASSGPFGKRIATRSVRPTPYFQKSTSSAMKRRSSRACTARGPAPRCAPPASPCPAAGRAAW